MNTPTNPTAVAYLRTSSITNVGPDKDSDKRQRDAVEAYAAAQGLTIVKEFYDAGISGADAVTERDGFNAMLTYLLGNGARIVLVENASRFARDLIVQLTGHSLLKQHGISLIPVDAPAHFEDETPTATMVRSILGAVSQFEKEAMVLKLRGARARTRKATKRSDTAHRCEGNPNFKPLPPAHVNAAKALVDAAREANKKPPSLRAIAAELLAHGLLNHSGRLYGAESIKRMLST